jgi:hypothetical protein
LTPAGVPVIEALTALPAAATCAALISISAATTAVMRNSLVIVDLLSCD